MTSCNFRVLDVKSDCNRMLLKVELERSTVALAIWDSAAEKKLSVVAPFFSDTRVACFVEASAENEWRKLLSGLATQGFIKKYDLHPEMVPVLVSGENFWDDVSALGKAVAIATSVHIPITLGASSESVITFAVRKNCAEEAVEALKKNFSLENFG